jgi:hypothetical protein
VRNHKLIKGFARCAQENTLCRQCQETTDAGSFDDVAVRFANDHSAQDDKTGELSVYAGLC